MHVARVQLATLVVAAALGAAGCKGSARGSSVTCTPPECSSDTTLQIVAEVDPPSDSQLVRQEFDSVTIDPQTGLFALALDEQVTLSGSVHVGDGATAKNVAATVVATRPSRIAGRPDVVYETTVNPIDGTYTLVVSRNHADEMYTVRATTTDLSLVPPKQLMVLADHDQTVDVAFASPLSLPELHGTIRDSLQQPVPGMQVQATTVPPDDTTAPTVVSTTTTTDINGAFSIRLSPTPPAKLLLVATPTAMATAQLPSLTMPVDATKLGTANSLTRNLAVPPLPAPAHCIYKVTGTGPSGADMAVPSASCLFTADVSDPHATDGTRATYRVSAMTDPLGQVTVDLIPTETGNRIYDVVVTPDATQPFGAKATTINVAPQGGYGPNIALDLRPQLSGRVLDPSGKALKNLMVVPSPSTVAAALGPTPFTVATTPQQATADTDGRFAVRLDKGFWDLGLVPPADSMLPRLWRAQLDLADGDVDIGALTMPKGVMVHGVVHDPTGAPLGHANVRLYTVAAGNAGCAAGDKSCLAPPRLRAEASSGTDGVVSLIMPSQPD